MDEKQPPAFKVIDKRSSALEDAFADALPEPVIIAGVDPSTFTTVTPERQAIIEEVVRTKPSPQLSRFKEEWRKVRGDDVALPERKPATEVLAAMMQSSKLGPMLTEMASVAKPLAGTQADQHLCAECGGWATYVKGTRVAALPPFGDECRCATPTLKHKDVAEVARIDAVTFGEHRPVPVPADSRALIVSPRVRAAMEQAGMDVSSVATSKPVRDGTPVDVTDVVMRNMESATTRQRRLERFERKYDTEALTVNEGPNRQQRRALRKRAQREIAAAIKQERQAALRKATQKEGPLFLDSAPTSFDGLPDGSWWWSTTSTLKRRVTLTRLLDGRVMTTQDD